MQLRSLLIGALRQGPIPKHIAFVMDGNRRFARHHGIETVEGHHLGFEALARVSKALASLLFDREVREDCGSGLTVLVQVLEVCYKSGVQVVTVYAFSIENFKRSKYEVDALMDMAKTKLAQLAQHGDLLQRYGASVRILGQRSLLKDDVLEAMDRAVEMTKNNGDAILNVCFPYTSQDEMTTAIRETVAEYSVPMSSAKRTHHRNRSFSESHIVHNIQARRLSNSAAESTDTTSPDASAPSPPTLRVTRSHSPNSSAAASDTEDSVSSTTTLYPESPFPEDSAIPNSNPTSLLKSNELPLPQRFDIGMETYPDPETISATTLTSHMFTAELPPLDLLVRTSGVERLSDFMLWQCHQSTDIVFLKCLWPEFDLWTFLPVLIEWQWKRRKGLSAGSPSVIGRRLFGDEREGPPAGKVKVG